MEYQGPDHLSSRKLSDESATMSCSCLILTVFKLHVSGLLAQQQPVRSPFQAV